MKSLYILAAVALAGSALTVSAHVTVTPSSAPGGSYQTFSVGVPGERAEGTTVALKLLFPEGIEKITPTVKPGWKITTGSSSVEWTGGSIPAGQRDEFTFSVKTPAEGTLVWKAYQTYSDGFVAAWDTAPEEHGHDHNAPAGPSSVTVLTPASAHDEHGAAAPTDHAGSGHGLNGPLIPLFALGASLLAVWEINKLQHERKK